MSWILKIDRRIIWIILVVLTFIPLVVDLGLPIYVEDVTRDYYQKIEDLPPGSIIVTAMDIEAGLWGEQGPQAISTMKHLFSIEGIKFIQVSFYRADCAVLFETMVLTEVDVESREYGVDWVNMGYLEGKETAMAAFANDFMYPARDAYGNSLEDLQLLDEISSMEDVDLFIAVQGSGYIDTCLRQLSIPYDVPAIVGTMGMGIPDMMTYLDAGIIDSYLGGLPGAAQYEYLIQEPGRALRGLDALSLTQLFLLALVAVTNIAYTIARSSGEKI